MRPDPYVMSEECVMTVHASNTSETWSGVMEAPRATPDGERTKNPPDNYVLSVVIPVYNERHTLLEILARVRAVAVPKEVLVVDDGSTDGTGDLLRDGVEGRFPDVRVFYHARNRGKGAATRTAIAEATGDFVVVQDADLEYDPREYFLLLEPLLDGRADVVFGSRFIGGGRTGSASSGTGWRTGF